MKTPLTLIDRLWDQHLVAQVDADQALIHIDRIFLHERVGATALQGLADAGHALFDRTAVFGTMDHIIDTQPGRGDATLFKGGRQFIQEFRNLSRDNDIPLFDIGSPDQGIVHVVSPEQGIVLPGCTLVCPDSHTGTVGALGALAWGIGATEAEHALATQTLLRRRPRRMRIELQGSLGPGVVAKDIILALIARFGAAGGQGHAIEFTGPVTRSLGMEGRLTLCNMAVEFGAWTSLIAPDEVTFDYLRGRPFAPRGEQWDQAVAHWRTLVSDDDAAWDSQLEFDCSDLPPQVTWGTSSEHAVGIDGRVPSLEAYSGSARLTAQRALQYMGLEPGMALAGVPIDAAFIGSCTNSRLSDLRAAAAVVKGRRVAQGVLALVVPGSSQVKRDAEREGLDQIFRDAGFEWRESGCSLCFFAGGDSFGAARRVVSTTNRNFEGRQGPGVRTHLASPATVAASALAGRLTDPRVNGAS